MTYDEWLTEYHRLIGIKKNAWAKYRDANFAVLKLEEQSPDHPWAGLRVTRKPTWIDKHPKVGVVMHPPPDAVLASVSAAVPGRYAVMFFKKDGSIGRRGEWLTEHHVLVEDSSQSPEDRGSGSTA